MPPAGVPAIRTPSVDVIVVGLGAAGSAAICHLARRGLRVLGIDRYTPPHTMGSTHGGSRIIRKAYFEGEQYLPLLHRAYALWRELEAEMSASLLNLCGCLNVGAPESAIVDGAQRSALAMGSAFEIMSATAVRHAFPAYHLTDAEVAVHDADAGLILPERSVSAHLAAAERHGATLVYGDKALAWHADGSGLRLTTARSTYRAGRLILCAGAWLNDILRPFKAPLHIERVTNAWFEPSAQAELFDPARCPVFIWEYDQNAHFYGCPNLGRGVKAGLHYKGAVVDHPDEVLRTVQDKEDIAPIRALLSRLLPNAAGRRLDASVCLYTNTPDKHYLMDYFPGDRRVVVGSACSGHGFKASAAVGEALADLAMDRKPAVDINAFRWRWPRAPRDA